LGIIRGGEQNLAVAEINGLLEWRALELERASGVALVKLDQKRQESFLI
jgi:hypothetical protein